MLRIGLIGHGYWGPNLLRNFMEAPGSQVVMVSDLRADRLDKLRSRYPSVQVTTDSDHIIQHPDIEAVVIATPVSTHFDLAWKALKMGKHVLVEKPLAATSDQALRLLNEADRRERILMVGHTFVYSGAVRKIKELVTKGYLGELYYYDSVRINLGLFQHDVNVIWDLAVHDLAIMDFVLPARPCGVVATGLNHISGRPEDISYLTIFYDQPLISHVHVNWLAPVKLRRTLIGGSQRMIVYDDLEPSEKVKVYDRGVTVNNGSDAISQMLIDYRTGDMWAPQLSTTEPLKAEVAHFLECVRSGTRPITGGEAGLRIVRLLEAACSSLAQRGQLVELEPM
jgi:predicted dehydrogenase